MPVSSFINEVKSYSFYHLVTFSLTFFGYAFFHATRKTFSNVKETISEEWTPSFHNATVESLKPDQTWNSHCLFADHDSAEMFLGWLDTAFLLSYAVGLYISGILGDRFNLRYVLSIGMCGSAVCVFVFGAVTQWTGLYNKPFYIIMWSLNGLIQSTGWPTMVAVMGNWFGKSSRGMVFGFWSACASVGNIFGSLMAAGVLYYGYEYAFLVPAAILFGWGIVTFFCLVPKPKELGLPDPEEAAAGNVVVTAESPTSPPDKGLISADDESDDEGVADQAQAPLLNVKPEEKSEAIGFFRAFLLPGVTLYALSYACLKFVNYAFFFWLPYYLSNKFGWSQADSDRLSIWYDVGGIVGGIFGGIFSDILQMRSPVVVGMLVIAVPFLALYNSVSPPSHVYNGLLLAVVSFFIGGPANLISSAIAADLGRQGPLQGNKEALATVTGIIDGTGSVGAAIGQFLIPVVHEHLKWYSVFYMFIIMTVLTAVCILPILVHEIKRMEWFQRRYRGPTQNVAPVYSS